jgi:uronate dehydrogenase
MRVLITGASGLIGSHLISALQTEHELVLGDIRPSRDPRSVHLDVTQPDAVRAAMRNVDAVVHTAIASGHEGDFEDDEFNQRRFDVNVKGTWNVLDAARRAGVRRFVHTSSLMVVWGYATPQPVASDAPAKPVGTYAVTKYLGEVLCEQVAKSHGLSVVCLRIPKPIDLTDPAWKRQRMRPQWIAFPDLVEAYRLGLIAPGIEFEIITVVGDSSRCRWDLSKARRLLGYQPRHRLEDHGFELGDEHEPLLM